METDDSEEIARKNVISICEGHNFPEPRVQTIGPLTRSDKLKRLHIGLLTVGQRKFSTYPELYPTENTAKLAVLRLAIKLEPFEDTPRDDGMQDIYAENFNAEQISEAELYGDVPAATTFTTVNGYHTESTEICGVPGAAEYEYEEVYADQGSTEPATEYATMAAKNEACGEVYEVVEQIESNEYTNDTAGYPAVEDQDIYANVTEVYENPADDGTGHSYSEQPMQEQTYSEEQLAQYSEAQYAQHSEEQAVQYSEEQLAQYSEEQVAQYSEEQVAQYSEEQAAQYSEEQVEQYSEEQVAQYSEEQVAQYSEEQVAQYSEEQAAQYSEEQVEQYSEEQYAQYSEEQYAQYAQAAEEHGLDPSGDPAQYYAAANVQAAAGDYGDVYEVIEASPEQVSPAEVQESELESETTVQCDEMAYTYEACADPAQASLYGSDEAASQQIDPNSQVYYESDPSAVQEIYYEDASYVAEAYDGAEVTETYGADAAAYQETELTAQESSETVVSVDSAFYDETSATPNTLYAEEQVIYDTGEVSPEYAYYEAGVGCDTNASAYYDGVELVQSEYAADEQTLIDGIAAMTLQPAVSEYQAADGTEVEYVTEYYAGETLKEENEVQQNTGTLFEEVDIYQLEQLPADAATGGLSDATAFTTPEAQTPDAEHPETEYVDPSYTSEYTQAQLEGVPTGEHYQSSTVGEVDIYQVEEVPETDAAIDGTVPEMYGTEAPDEELDNCGLTGSMQSRLQRALIVNISFDGHVTLNLYGPVFEAFSLLEYKHKAEPVTACELNHWYAVDYDSTDGSGVKRAVAQHALEDGQSYMMHFLDEDYVSSVPISSIFELENPIDVSRIPPQGVTVEVMELTEKKVSPHTVEILLSQWLYRDVYVIPVDTTGAVPKVRLIDAFGELLNV